MANDFEKAKWDNYKIIASGGGEKLEMWGEYILLRPDPQAIWQAPFDLSAYKGLDAKYTRSASGGGEWSILSKKGQALADGFTLDYQQLNLKFNLRLMNFKHTGLFPEQSTNWLKIYELIKNSKQPTKVLNLFAYTGGATLACARAGASVAHIDASKGMVAKAKENLALSGMADRPVRFLVDDCLKFVLKEQRRGNKYNAIILDPPTYGRGPNGEIWKLAEHINVLLSESIKLLEKPLFVLLNAYATDLQKAVFANLLSLNMHSFGGRVDSYELILPTEQKGIDLPAGMSAMWSAIV
ncbi:MAG: class I SAM-dependent methyltransferase [Firmicutes bacterium]|nr:class I SAM-dependent methyltransferase [Bacillota bacterium]